MSRWCPGGVQVVCRWCAGGVQVVCKWCAGGVQVVSRWCAGGVQVVCRWCPGRCRPSVQVSTCAGVQVQVSRCPGVQKGCARKGARAGVRPQGMGRVQGCVHGLYAEVYAGVLCRCECAGVCAGVCRCVQRCVCADCWFVCRFALVCAHLCGQVCVQVCRCPSAGVKPFWFKPCRLKPFFVQAGTRIIFSLFVQRRSAMVREGWTKVEVSDGWLQVTGASVHRLCSGHLQDSAACSLDCTGVEKTAEDGFAVSQPPVGARIQRIPVSLGACQSEDIEERQALRSALEGHTTSGGVSNGEKDSRHGSNTTLLLPQPERHHQRSRCARCRRRGRRLEEIQDTSYRSDFADVASCGSCWRSGPAPALRICNDSCSNMAPNGPNTECFCSPIINSFFSNSEEEDFVPATEHEVLEWMADRQEEMIVASTPPGVFNRNRCFRPWSPTWFGKNRTNYQQTWVASVRTESQSRIGQSPVSSDGELLIRPNMGLDVLPGVGGEGCSSVTVPMTELASIVSPTVSPVPHMDAIQQTLVNTDSEDGRPLLLLETPPEDDQLLEADTSPRIRLQQSEHPGTREHPEELHWSTILIGAFPGPFKIGNHNRVEAADCLT